MTRRPRPDSEAAIRATLRTMEAQAAGPDNRTPAQQAWLEAKAKSSRHKPVPKEFYQHIKLNADAAMFWWYPGFQSHVPERSDWTEGTNAKRVGQKPGWPDTSLLVPPHVRAVCELKEWDKRPRTAVPAQWWLSWHPVDEYLRYLKRQRDSEPSRYGLRATQAFQLQALAACKFSTFVAYSAAEALEWLNKQAGPKPASLPAMWV